MHIHKIAMEQLAGQQWQHDSSQKWKSTRNDSPESFGRSQHTAATGLDL